MTLIVFSTAIGLTKLWLWRVRIRTRKADYNELTEAAILMEPSNGKL